MTNGPEESGEGFTDASVEPGMQAAVEAIKVALKKGTVETRPDEDAAAIARIAKRHRLKPEELTRAVNDIADFSRRPETPLGRVVFRVWGDHGTIVLTKAWALLQPDPELQTDLFSETKETSAS